MRSRLPDIIAHITKVGNMHDINKRRIALVKAKIAELEKWENRDTHAHNAELTRGGAGHNARERDNTEQEITPNRQGPNAHKRSEEYDQGPCINTQTAPADATTGKKRKGQREEEETQDNTHKHTENTQKRQKRVTMEHKTEDRAARTRLNENRRSQLQHQPPGDDDPRGMARKWGD